MVPTCPTGKHVEGIRGSRLNPCPTSVASKIVWLVPNGNCFCKRAVNSRAGSAQLTRSLHLTSPNMGGAKRLLQLLTLTAATIRANTDSGCCTVAASEHFEHDPSTNPT